MKQKFLNYFLLIASAVFISVSMPSCSSHSDADIQKAVNEKLQAMPESANVTATVDNGVATLTGDCSDASAKEACATTAKSVEGVKTVVNNCNVTPAAILNPGPVDMATDDALTNGVNDAIKDYKDVKATVTDGVVTLTGEIQRSDLQNLMQSLNTLNPKKINNQLVIK